MFTTTDALRPGTTRKETMRKIFGAGLILSAISAAPALAADLGSRSSYTPPANDFYSPTPASTWTGFYIGALGGYGGGRFNRGQGGLFGQTSGGLFGLTGGFQFQSGQFVGGIEADHIWANISNFRSQPGIVMSNARVENLFTARVRAGYAFDRLLAFATVGIAGGSIKTSLYDATLPVPAGGPLYTDHRWRNGWAAGLGLEYAITNNVSAKGEYLYVNLRSRSMFTGAYATQTGMDISMLRMGLNYRF